MRSTFQNSGTALSIGVFFSLMIAGLAASLPKTMTSGLEQHGVPHAVAHQIGSLPPVSSLFATVLGVNPVQHLLAQAHALSTLPAASQRILTGKEFFPALISGAVPPGPGRGVHRGRPLSAVAAFASLLRGGRYVPPESAAAPVPEIPVTAPAPVAPATAQDPKVPADGTKNRVLTVRRDEPGRRGTE